MKYKEIFEKKKLLTDGKANAKVAKNKTKTFYLSLQPTDLNSAKLNLCKFSTKECRSQCLQYAGRQGFSTIVKSRENKTEFFVKEKKDFLIKLWNELSEINKKPVKTAVRLNLLSDLDWELEFKSINKSLSELSNIQFYDYTKDHFKVLGNNLKNYNITFSFSGHNWKWCEKFLTEKRANVAIVFKNKLPLTYKGFKVIDGDQSDERFLEEKGVIIGLKYKQPKFSKQKYEQNKFVIE